MHPLVVSDPLEKVADFFGFKKRHRQSHDFCKKIGDDRDIHPGTDVQKNPASDKLDRRPSDKQHELAKQDRINESDVTCIDPKIDNGLGQKGKNQSEKRAGQQGEENLKKQLSVGFQITGEKTKSGAGVIRFGFITLFEFGRRFKHEDDTVGGSIVARRYPAVEEIGFGVGNQSVRRIGNVHFSSSDPMDDDKMPLAPVHDTRQRRFFFQLFK